MASTTAESSTKRKRGRPKQDLLRLTINLRRDTLEDVHRLAEEANITTTRYIEQAIAAKQFLDEHNIRDFTSDGVNYFMNFA